MQPEPLTDEDVEIINDALDAWLNRDQGANLAMNLMAGLFVKDDPVAKAKWEEEKAREKAEAAEQKRREKVVVALLKAKVIKLANQAEVASIAAADLR